ncbi:hypothetical protein QBC38DRAFT_460730 [Podospora fimiseda]|uniref:Protein kinase domain-containing protein n=1 Tax=Podospora fimiseda TaxID=252190 RepID=A0AAN6YMS7_9PEZI|nr:hypothetical protein QBC38DRAFT_460730 [Podospora fimiseda]
MGPTPSPLSSESDPYMMDEVDSTPLSLLQILSTKDFAAPSLSQRFYLTLSLARCISQLQLVKWVHESFRSENILFFSNSPQDGEKNSLESRITLSEPWVFGFEFSRPDPFFSDGRPDICLSRDVYRHPERQQRPTHQFSKIHDIYALGVVLLEIGLWQPVLAMEKVGEKHKDVVLKCLQGNFGVTNDTKEDLALQQAFRGQVVDVLQRASDNV